MNTSTAPSGRKILTLKRVRPGPIRPAAPTPLADASDEDNTSVAGEEDPGSSLEFMTADVEDDRP
jgi:hypothetical protein